MKVLIITYYWPPSGGSGVQRWLYFTKYLRDFGVEPVIFTVKNPNYPIDDFSLINQIPKNIEVLRQKIWEPNNVLNSKKRKTSSGFLSENPSFTQKILQYIRANYFIPDARKFWIRPSVKKIISYLSANNIDWIITTGPPHSVHLIGKQVKEKTNIKWLADFRDPWTEIDYFHQLPLSKRSLNKHLQLEKSVLSKANIVTVVSNTMAEKYKTINQNCHVITNGYDGKYSTKTSALDDQFTLTHIGLLNADRNSKIFWKVIKELTHENEEFKNKLSINLIGKVANEVIEAIQKNKLENFVKITNYLPHNKVFSYLRSSQILLLFVNDVPSAKGIVTGKIFEYLLAKRPILAIAPTDGDLSEIIKSTNSGVAIDFKDKDVLKNSLLKYFNNFQRGDLDIKSNSIEKYHRRYLTKQLVKLLKNN